MSKQKKYIYYLLASSNSKGDASWYLDVFITLLIIFNIIAVVLASVRDIEIAYSTLFQKFEIFSVTIFTIEYVLRVWAITSVKRYAHPIKGRIHFIFSPIAIIDLLAILPFYIGLFTFDLRFVRILRLFRLFRIFKIARYIRAVSTINMVLKEKKEQLHISITLIMVMLLFVSSTMYYIENEAQPDVFSSIPETMWWGVATLTTVGYGDVYPITTLGKILGSVISILGVGLFALPTGILASGFMDVMGHQEVICQRCKEKIEH